MTELLTETEQKVLKHLSYGLFANEIARKLEISEEDTNRHIERIYKKLNTKDRIHAILEGINQGYIVIDNYIMY
jgi:DNA-binding NarL/FixJ family response regulator